MNTDYKSLVALAGLVAVEIADGSDFEEISAYKNFFSMISTNLSTILCSKGQKKK